MSQQQTAVDAARSHRAGRAAEIVAEFVELLALPNVSRNRADVARVADHVAGMLSARGVRTDVVTRDGAAPVIVGHFEAEGATRTIGFYAHYDGQPVDQPEWELDPFRPTLLDGTLGAGGEPVAVPASGEPVDPEWRIYARSAADDKAPIAAICAALDALNAAGIAPSANLLFLFEGEEEIGSPQLPGYLTDLRDRLAVADVWLICDGPVHQTRRPQIVFGVRGIAEMEITAYGPIRPLHSGHYGNWAPNPNMELARLVASMKDDHGDVVIAGFYEGTQAITATDRAAVAALPDDDDGLRRELSLGATEAGGAALALRLLQPSLNIRGFDGGGVGARAANVIPTQATASIDIRLAPGNHPESMMDRVEEHVRSQGWHVVHDDPDPATRRAHARVARIERNASYPGVRMPTDSPLAGAIVAAAAAAAEAKVVVVPTFGGSVPMYHFTSILGAEVVITPFANHDNNQHAANENLRISNLWYGIDLMAALMTLDLPTAQRPS